MHTKMSYQSVIASDGDNVIRLVNKKNASAPVWENFVFSPDAKGEPAKTDGVACISSPFSPLMC